MGLTQQRYAKVPTEDYGVVQGADVSEIYSTTCRNETHRRGRVYHFLAGMATSMFLLLAVLGIAHHTAITSASRINEGDSTSSITYSCGNTTAEARALGCSFDLLTQSWLPERCRDRELTDEYRQAGPFQYSLDSQGKELLSEEDLAQLEYLEMYYTTQGEHVVHCIFMWRKLLRAMQHGWKVEATVTSDAHIQHCGKVFLDRSPLDAISTLDSVGFESC